ncbi:MAG: glycogen/starch/alpha-glucan phosphorylase, partial [Nostoc sp.]|uniref:glycogen/starch/alpha-glucan phosphorylase n=1 Tax=Nostoc sp. TaxID=1180 RepID=UPI002FFC4CB2
EEVYDLKSKGYNPWDYYHNNPQLKEAIDLINSGFFSHGDTNLFRPTFRTSFCSINTDIKSLYKTYIKTLKALSN